MGASQNGVRHVVWDWNGTLVDDSLVILECVNQVLDAFGIPHVTADFYRSHFSRPVTRFYESLLGSRLSPSDWISIEEGFRTAYRERVNGVALRPDAAGVLRQLRSNGTTQSILSMWHEDDLLSRVWDLDIGQLFIEIDGSVGVGGGRKAARLRRHLRQLRINHGIGTAGVVMVGDTLDDADAAADSRVRCVLIDGGSHHRAALEQSGSPVVGSLSAAVELWQ